MRAHFDDLDRLPKMSPCDELVERPMPLRLAWKLPRVRFTLRWIMIAVAIAAMILALGVTVHRRREHYERLVAYHEDQAQAAFAEASQGITCLMGLESLPFVDPEVRERKALERHTKAFGTKAGLALKRAYEHRYLSEAYWRAARRPWIDLVLRSPEP
jgi:hypothetical protein